MQIVQREHPNALPIMDDIDRLYCQLSEFENGGTLIKQRYDESFSMLVGTFEEFTDHKWSIEFENRDYTEIEPINPDDTIILTFSGGKDSVASALRYKQMGYKVYLYHLRHINPSLSDEWKSAKKLAELLDLPIYFDDIHFKGYHCWTEHPMKNMLIANGALSYGIRENITTHIAFGNYNSSYLEDNYFDRCAGDCMDMWEAYNDIIQRCIPNFEMDVNLTNMGDTLDILADRTDLINASISCLCRHSLRDYRRNWVKDTYGIELFEHRCGSCYKCCVEYMYMADHDKMPYSEDYYKYCLGQLYKVAQAEKVPVTDITDVWGHFIAYPIEQSKLQSILNCKMLRTKIKWWRGVDR